MDATAAALLGAALGAITALAGAAITAYVALYNERQRRDEVERHAFTTALRAATADVFVQFHNFSHATDRMLIFGERLWVPRTMSRTLISGFAAGRPVHQRHDQPVA